MTNKKQFWTDRSLWSLIATNLLVITLALLQNWEIATLLWIYWGQSVVIGIFNFRRILALKNFSTENFKINGRPVEPTRQTKLYTAYFFLVHYGLFHFIYAIFLGTGKLAKTSPLNWKYVLISISIFLVNHAYSFWHNKKEDEKRKQNIGQVMFAPYARIIPMHLVILFGAFAGSQLRLVLFLLLKIAADATAHTLKHKGSSTQIKNELK